MTLNATVVGTCAGARGRGLRELRGTSRHGAHRLLHRQSSQGIRNPAVDVLGGASVLRRGGVFGAGVVDPDVSRGRFLWRTGFVTTIDCRKRGSRSLPM